MKPRQKVMKNNYQQLIISLTIVCFAAILMLRPAAAQEAIKVTGQNWDSLFRDHLTFTLKAESPAEIVEADLLYRVAGQLATSRNKANFIPGTSITAEFTIDQNDPSNYFPPGAELEYWWSLTDANGNELKTERETITYLDGRFEWQTLENERLTLYWYQGDDAFGQALFDRANEALDTLETDIGIALENPIKIFIYANHQDLLSALSTTSQEWTGGVAYTTYGVVVIGVHPGQLDWGLGAMTHEMTHLVIHQATDNPFSGLPRWLDEGIAVYNENQEELDDDFKPIFDRAVAGNQLMTLRTLSSPFPADPLQANLAYGQSGAVVKYIVDTYGPDKMANLLSIFAEGALYDEALEQALGVNTDQLDNEFRVSLGLPPLPGSEPADAVAVASEETNSESIEPAEETQAEVAEAEEAEQAEPVPTPAQNSQSEPVAPQPETPAEEPAAASGSLLSFIPCLGAILFLLITGGAIYSRRF